MSVTDSTLRLQRQLDAALADTLTRQESDLIRAWVTAWDEIVPDLNAALLEQLTAGAYVSRGQLLRSVRLRRALQVVADRLVDLAGVAAERIAEDLRDVLDTAGGAQASIIDSQLPPNAPQLLDLDAWTGVDERQLTAIVTRSTEQITATTRRLAPEAQQIVRRELIRGVASGSNPRATAARMLRRAERYGFNGGLTRALVIARTETVDAHNRAAELGQAQHADVLRGWVWLAELSIRTCPSCIGMHGTEHPLSEPGPLDHQQGRCARVPLTRPWSDLGLDVEEPAPIIPDREAFFDSLPEREQRSILGPARYTAWTQGRFPMDQWAQRRSTDGWRDSYVPAPAPQSGGRSRSAA